jgi:hypothetical protein
MREKRKGKDGEMIETGARYVEMMVYGWAEEAGPFDARLANLYENLESQALDVIDADDSFNPDAALDPDLPQIEQQPDEPVAESKREPEKAPVQAEKPAESGSLFPNRAANGKSAAPSAEVLRKIADIEAEMNPHRIDDARRAAGLSDAPLADQPKALVTKYLASLAQES